MLCPGFLIFSVVKPTGYLKSLWLRICKLPLGTLKPFPVYCYCWANRLVSSSPSPYTKGMIFFRGRHTFPYWESKHVETVNDPIHPEDHHSICVVSPLNVSLGLKNQELSSVWVGISCMWSEQPCPKQPPAVLFVLLPFVGNEMNKPGKKKQLVQPQRCPMYWQKHLHPA